MMTPGMEGEALRLYQESTPIGADTQSHLEAATVFAQSAADNWRDETATASQCAIYAAAAALHLAKALQYLGVHYGD